MANSSTENDQKVFHFSSNIEDIAVQNENGDEGGGFVGGGCWVDGGFRRRGGFGGAGLRGGERRRELNYESSVFGPEEDKEEEWKFNIKNANAVGLNPIREGAILLNALITRVSDSPTLNVLSVSALIVIKYNGKVYQGKAFKQCEEVVRKNLSLNAEISILTGWARVMAATESISAVCSMSISASTSNSSVFKLFDGLFLKEEFGDVTIEAGEHKYLVYKGILSERSPVFKAAFTTDMKESNERVYTINDINPDVVREMLYFMYTGRVPNVENMAAELLVAAEKYELGDLKNLSERNLAGKITVDNACGRLIFADQNNAVYLKQTVLEFIKLNFKGVKANNSFKASMIDHPDLLIEIVQML